jgi:ACT domain-containing protein
MNSSAPQVDAVEHPTKLVESVVVNGTVHDSFCINGHAALNRLKLALDVNLKIGPLDERTNSATVLVRAKSQDALEVAVQTFDDINSDPEMFMIAPETSEDELASVIT